MGDTEMKIGFDNEKYLQLQAEHITARRAQFGGKLYLEFGGKLFDDYHASRVLPGFQPDSKIRMLQTLKDDVEIVIAICAGDIEKNKMRGDLGISYDADVLRLIDVFRDLGFYVGSVVITQYAGQPAADAFIKRLDTLGVRSCKHYPIAGYPSDVAHIVSDAGLGRNDYIETSRPLIVVTAPGPGSGKMATCLSQLYHDNRRGIPAGYAKYETFPIWNLPLKHPVNLAYEAATADLNDVNMIDPFHLEAYGVTTVNYNRDVEIVIAICAGDIEKNKMRGDLGISYDADVLRLIDVFRDLGFYVGSVVITQYAGQPAADAFIKRLDTLGVRSCKHYPIAGYPSDVAHIVSDAGLGRNDYIETSRPLIVVTAPGPGSGKMATCLSQLYHDNRRGIPAGYAKYETFPIWNLPLKHPVNLAYEAATADLNDVNMIDPFHLEAYGVTTVNYNRDVEIFPVLAAMFKKIQGECPYKSPTDMGVNMAGFAIVDDDVCQEASRMEILRRYYAGCVERAKGQADECVVRKLELVMQQADVTPELCPAVAAALEKAEATGKPAGAMVLPDGCVVTGKTSPLLGASAALLLNALKHMAGIDHKLELIPASVIEPISAMKTGYLGHRNPRLHSDEVLIALAISGLTNPLAAMVQEQLKTLRDCDAHFSVIISEEDAKLYKRLGINVSCEPKYEVKSLYHKK